MTRYIFVALLLLTPVWLYANDDTIQIGNDTLLSLFPHSHLYPENIADPHRPTFMMATMYYDKSTIPNTSRRRFGLKLGGRLGLLRIHDVETPEEGFQLSLDAGFNGQFDADQSEDNIGWDGIYSLMGQYRFSPEWAMKLGVHHTSSHIGDEFIERTGAQRINYTRQEVQLGVNWAFTQHWQFYAETGYGHDLRNEELQEPWRWQTGIQYQSKANLWRDNLGWYAALDLTATQERDYSVDTTFQTGVVYYSGYRRWRAGIEFYNGRAQIGELFQNDVQYISLAAWLDI